MGVGSSSEDVEISKFLLQVNNLKPANEVQNNPSYGQGKIFDQPQESHQQYILIEQNIPLDKRAQISAFLDNYKTVDTTQIPTVVPLLKYNMIEQRSACSRVWKLSLVFKFNDISLVQQIHGRKNRYRNPFTEVQILDLLDCLLSGLMLLQKSKLYLKQIQATDIVKNKQTNIYSICLVRSIFEKGVENLIEVDEKDKLSVQKNCVKCLGQIAMSCALLSLTQKQIPVPVSVQTNYSEQLGELLQRAVLGNIKQYYDLYHALAPLQGKQRLKPIPQKSARFQQKLDRRSSNIRESLQKTSSTMNQPGANKNADGSFRRISQYCGMMRRKRQQELRKQLYSPTKFQQKTHQFHH